MNVNSLTRKLQLVVFLSALNMLTSAVLVVQANGDKATFYPSVGIAETMERVYQLNPY